MSFHNIPCRFKDSKPRTIGRDYLSSVLTAKATNQVIHTVISPPMELYEEVKGWLNLSEEE